MTARVARDIEARRQPPAASLAEWAGAINRLAAKTGRKHPCANAPHLIAQPRSATVGYRMAPEVAEHLVTEGLDPDFIGEVAAFSGLEARDVLDFAGIDRTTISRRKASGSALPQHAAVKALQMTDLVAQATEAFGSPVSASQWLTKAHPSLDGETPLRRARTPWGMNKVQSMLVALRYGGAA